MAPTIPTRQSNSTTTPGSFQIAPTAPFSPDLDLDPGASDGTAQALAQTTIAGTTKPMTDLDLGLASPNSMAAEVDTNDVRGRSSMVMRKHASGDGGNNFGAHATTTPNTTSTASTIAATAAGQRQVLPESGHNNSSATPSTGPNGASTPALAHYSVRSPLGSARRTSSKSVTSLAHLLSLSNGGGPASTPHASGLNLPDSMKATSGDYGGPMLVGRRGSAPSIQSSAAVARTNTLRKLETGSEGESRWGRPRMGSAASVGSSVSPVSPGAGSGSGGNEHPGSAQHGKLKPGFGLTRTLSNASSGAATGSKLFTTLSTSVKTTFAPGNLGPKPADLIQSIASAAHAKHYTDPDIAAKLKLLVISERKFDEMMEDGFPVELGKEDLEALGGLPRQDQDGPLSMPPLLPMQGDAGSSQSSSSTASLERIRESVDSSSYHFYRRRRSNTDTLRSSSRYSSATFQTYTDQQPPKVPDGPREMTLKFTLTPASMRADEAVLYGWQTSSPSGTTSEPAVEEEGAAAAAVAEDGSSGLSRPLMQVSGHDEIGIGIGGGGVDVGGGGSVHGLGQGGQGLPKFSSMKKRMFGKLKKGPKTELMMQQRQHGGSSVMITSADV